MMKFLHKQIQLMQEYGSFWNFISWAKKLSRYRFLI
jgi:hypothetical protein